MIPLAAMRGEDQARRISPVFRPRPRV